MDETSNIRLQYSFYSPPSFSSSPNRTALMFLFLLPLLSSYSLLVPLLFFYRQFPFFLVVFFSSCRVYAAAAYHSQGSTAPCCKLLAAIKKYVGKSYSYYMTFNPSFMKIHYKLLGWTGKFMRAWWYQKRNRVKDARNKKKFQSELIKPTLLLHIPIPKIFHISLYTAYTLFNLSDEHIYFTCCTSRSKK